MEFSIFNNFPELRYGLSEKKDGSMNSPITIDNADRRALIVKNREKFLGNVGIGHEKIVEPYLAHGSKVVVINEENYKEPYRADGFVTASPGIVLTITVADCFPLYFYDPVKKVVGLSHAGWRGIIAGIVENTIKTFVSEFNSDPKDIVLGVGPGIQKCHFEVQNDVANQFAQDRLDRSFVLKESGIYTVDLNRIIAARAGRAGIASMEANNQCTFCRRDVYFSYRRDNPGQIPEVMLAYLGIM